MSFKFDQSYLDSLEKHREEFEKEGCELPKSPLEAYIEWINGNMLCGCDHGCNSTTLENGPKMLAIIKELKNGSTLESLDRTVMIAPETFAQEMHTNMWLEIKNRRKI